MIIVFFFLPISLYRFLFFVYYVGEISKGRGLKSPHVRINLDNGLISRAFSGPTGVN